MALTIDHLPFAWTDLDEITAEFSRLGLEPEYGGAHDNGATHMSVLGFEDGSYVELIAERGDGEHGFWPEHIRADAGPAAWCIRVPDIVAECRRVLESGVSVHGPLYGARERDDGTLVEWDRAVFGTEEQRLLLPFAIEDRTPLSYRVTESPSVAGGPLTGVGQTVLATDSLERDIEVVRELYRLPKPIRASVSEFGTVASFPGEPLALAAPDGDSGDWLDERLDQFRPCPCAVLLATDDIANASEAYPLTQPASWPEGRVAFFESELLGRRVGVVER